MPCLDGHSHLAEPALALACIGLHMSCGFTDKNQFTYSAWFSRFASAGCGEWRMVMGCGVAPRGSLRLAHLAAKLTPTISGGPCMPVSCSPQSVELKHYCLAACLGLLSQALGPLTSTATCAIAFRLLHSADSWYAGQISARLGPCVCLTVLANHH